MFYELIRNNMEDFEFDDLDLDLSQEEGFEPDSDVVDDDFFTEPTEESTEEFVDETPEKGEDYITKMLRERGIDRNKIRFQNEEGEIEEYNWDELDEEDKYAILNDYESPVTQDELQTLNYLRDNNMNLQDFAKWQRDEAIREYLSQNQVPQYEIDELSDEELYAYDLMTRFGDSITDEEIDMQLERAKENEELFKKTVGLLRSQYKASEDAKKTAEETAASEQRKQEYNEFVDQMVDAAKGVQEIQGIELEDEDREKILDFLLKENPSGETEFYKLLSNPEMIFKMAWFALYGEETFNSTVDYFQKKLAEARRGSQPQSQKPKVIKKTKTKDPDPYGLDEYFKN